MGTLRSIRKSAHFTLAATLVLSGCAKKVAVSPPPNPPPVVIPKAEAPPKPPPLPPAPRIKADNKAAAEATPPVTVEVSPPPPPAPAPRKIRRSTRRSNGRAEAAARAAAEAKAAEAKSLAESEAGNAPTAETPTAPVPAAPQLGLILTAEQSREYTKRLDDALDRSKNALVLIQGKTLTTMQKETLGRIQAFVLQAEQARDQDLVSATNLAERADLLSKDLLERLK